MRLVTLALLLAVAACGPTPSRSPGTGSPAGMPAGSGCRAYSPPICMGGHVRCFTDADGCETCTCDSASPPGPGK